MLELSDASTHERLEHYLTQYGGTDIHSRLEILDIAQFAAQAEMLDEIHAMLRQLYKKE